MSRGLWRSANQLRLFRRTPRRLKFLAPVCPTLLSALAAASSVVRVSGIQLTELHEPRPTSSSFPAFRFPGSGRVSPPIALFAPRFMLFFQSQLIASRIALASFALRETLTELRIICWKFLNLRSSSILTLLRSFGSLRRGILLF